jgi:hypothetical protein
VRGHQRQVVADQDRREAEFVAQGVDQRHDLRLDLRIEPGRRLVEYQ